MEAKILERVRKLLAKAENDAVTPQEAQSLTAKASELMAKYNIDRALLAATQPVQDKPASKRIKVTNPWRTVHAHLLARLATATGMQAIRVSGTQGSLFVHVFGYVSDVERVELLYTSVMLQMANGVKHVERRGWMTTAQFRAERRSWLMGYVAGVVGLVEEAEARVRQDVVQEKGTGAELVLADRSLVIQNAYDTAYPERRTVRMTFTGSQYGNGYKAGRSANIGGTAVGRRTAGALR